MNYKEFDKQSRRKLKVIAMLSALPLFFFAGIFFAESRQSKLFFSKPEIAASSTELAKRHAKWANRVLKGGYILHFRHAQREKWRDSAAFDAYELAQDLNAEASFFQRATCLTEQGIAEAKLIGKVFDLVGVAVSEVFSSPSCRGWQTAKYAFGTDYAIVNSLLNRTAVLAEQRPAFNKHLRDFLMSVPVPVGQNVVLTGHGATFTYQGLTIIDENNTIRSRPRHETGFTVFERVDGKLIAHHTFASIKDFANALIELPLDRR